MAPSNQRDQPSLFFQGFSEYWHFAKIMTEAQRGAILRSLSAQERREIERSYDSEGWEDLFMRDAINSILDKIKDEDGLDVIDARIKTLRGQSVYVPRRVWEKLVSMLGKINPKHHGYAVGGIKAVPCLANADVVLLLPQNSREIA